MSSDEISDASRAPSEPGSDGTPGATDAPASPRRSVPPAYFAALYRADRDPWRMRTSAYEQEKYRETIALLPPRRFRSALEVGCSIGVLTRLLSGHAERLLAVDVDDLALSRARETCRDRDNVTFEKRVVPGDWPAGMFDLIVLSEVLYFLDPADIEATARCAAASAGHDALIVLVNWLGRTDAACDGDTAAKLFIAAVRPSFLVGASRRTPDYRMDLLARA
jgi:SAM-dependent methyltransferase